MKTYKRLLVALLAVVCILCSVVAVSCSKDVKKTYTVTFIDGDTVYSKIEVEMGKRLVLPEAPTRADENYIFDGWYFDENAEKIWDVNVERVTKDVVLWSNFLYVSQQPGNVSMDNTAFSNTVTWLQRGIDLQTEFSIQTRQGMLVSETGYVYSDELSNNESALNGANGSLTLTPYGNHDNVYTVRWTPAQVPQGGVYSVTITCANGSATQDGLMFKGAGTQSNPYLLLDSADLAYINSTNVAQDTYYKLQQSFNVKLIAKDISGNTFDGYLDGNGKTLTVDSGGCGLFATLGENALIEDLTVAGDIDAVENCVGVIASVNNGRIDYCTVSAGIKSSIGTVGTLQGDSNSITGGAGGLVGVNNGAVTNSVYSGTARANVGAGGIAVINNGEITNCSYGGTLGAGNAVESGSSTNEMSYMGGIAAINYGKIQLCSATGRLLAQRSMTGAGANNNIGGIVAYNTADGVVERCFTNSQRIYGNKNVGGIAGENSGAISYCYVTANYRSNIKSHNYIGGSANVGGIAGLTNAGATVANCYALANVYAYDSAAYKIAESCESCVYLGGNLDDRDFTVINTSGETKATPASNLILPEGDSNIAVELTASVKEEYAAKAYTLTLDETQFTSLNGNNNYYKSRTNVTFDVTVGAKERQIELNVIVDGNVQTETLGKVAGNKLLPSAPDKGDSYLIGFALTPNGKVVFEEGKAIGYEDVAIFNRDVITLYPVYKQGERPESTILNVAVYGRFIDGDLVAALIEAFKKSQYFEGYTEAYYTVLTEYSVADYANAVKAGNAQYGKYNISFGHNNLDVGQGRDISVRVVKVDGDLATRQVGIIGNDSVASKFGEFLATDTAKKIMNPEYISEAEADTFEVTLMNGAAQYGDGLILSNATDTTHKQIELPKVTEIPDGYSAFEGWALTETAADGEKLFNGTQTYANLASYAQEGKLTLYARFKVGTTDPKPERTIIVGFWTYGNAVNSTVIAGLEKEFETYAKENNLTFAVEFREYSIDTYAKVADLVGQLKEDGDVAYILGIGKSSGDLVFVDGTKTQVGTRYVAQLVEGDDASAFHTFATQSTVLKNS